MNPESNAAGGPASLTTESQRKPPQAIEAESAVLGSILLDQSTLTTALQYLKPEHFYLQAHRKVYQAMLNLFEHGKPTDIVTVSAELRTMKDFDSIGGQPFLSGLQDSVLTTVHCEEYSKLVLEKAVQRRLIEAANEIIHDGYDPSSTISELLDAAEQKIFDIHQSGQRKGFAALRDLLKDEMERVDKAMQERKFITGVPTGFHELDEKTSGLQAGDLVIIAGRPSMGKTALALNIALTASSRHSIPVAIFSLEMSSESLVLRLMCAEAGVSMQNVRRGHLSREDRTKIVAALGPLAEAKLYIDDSPSLNALDIRARSRRLRSESPLGMIVIDYLQLMEAHSDRRRERNRQQEISDITRGLKAMAKELNVPVVVLSQLSRAPEQRGGDKKPQLSDLRESGAIEQDADVVILLYRGEFYSPNDEALRGKAEAIIAKQRNGPLGTVDLAFLGHCMRFENPYLREAPEAPERGAEYDDVLPE